MMPDTQNLLSLADQWWEVGLLLKACAAYRDVLARDPSNWHAAFQLAWIEVGFGRIDADRVDALQRPGLAAAAAERIEQLRKRLERGPFLDGTIADWDLNGLRGSSDAKTARWWEEHAAYAAAAGQYGLALACFGEAEALAPEMYFDPPAAFKAAPHPGKHLAAVRSADGTK
jgi:tetratricopeptide (TPR) repeat protein